MGAEGTEGDEWAEDEGAEGRRGQVPFREASWRSCVRSVVGESLMARFSPSRSNL
jgi:hypothetical protein